MHFYSIEKEEDIEYLMNNFLSFHDSCIKELKYVSGGYVAEDRSMYPFNSLRQLNIIFQSQKGAYPMIEMQFESIHRLNLEPRGCDYDCIIYESTLRYIDGLFYWSEWNDFKPEDIGKVNGTWIVAEKVKWRPVENLMGNKDIYIFNSN